MKWIALLLLLPLAACNQNAPSSSYAYEQAPRIETRPPEHMISFTLPAGREISIPNQINLRDFRITATYPVEVDEAGCSWREVTSAHFTCSDVANISVTDSRQRLGERLLGAPNQITITFRAWLKSDVPGSDN